MEKQIIFVGDSAIQAPSVTHLAYDSNNSLLDGDIVVLSLDLSTYSAGEPFQGLPCLTDDSSFRLLRQSHHWNSELSIALEHGKTVIVHLTNVGEVSVATGEKQYSGTGRNARGTRIVATFEPYSVIPAIFGKVVRRSGEVIKASADLGILATYWHEFGTYSTYQCYIDDFKGSTLLTTQTGGKTVAGILRQRSWKGTLVFLPPPDLSAAVDARAESLKSQKRKKAASDSTASSEKSYRSRAEVAVVGQYVASLVALDKAARSATDHTPPPVWSQESRYMLQREAELRTQIAGNVAEAQKLQEQRRVLNETLHNAQQLKWLLYEKGKPLESAILTALRILGFAAENLQESDSEFDAVMLDPSGARLIGEAEGKDDRAISVDKLDQLDRNLREDFARQDDANASYAKGVLFGNAHRLSPPEDRPEFFTTKCLLAAKRSRISLVRTTDLFEVAHHLDDSPDEAFAAACRRAIIENDGEMVVFPNVPARTAAAS